MGEHRLFDEYFKNVEAIEGPLLFAKRVSDIAYGATVVISSPENNIYGQVLELTEELVVIQVLGSTHGLQPTEIVLRYDEDVFRLPVSRYMLGRVLDGKGSPIDGAPIYPADKSKVISGSAINPVSRAVPCEYIETGVSAIDLMNTLVKGQKLPIFSCAGLPSNELAASIVKNVASFGGEERELVVVFAGMGITHREYSFFLEEFEKEGRLGRTVVFLNRADEPVIERLMAPRCALTAAEHLAFELGYDVLVILTDMTHYCEALREVSSAREEIAGRRGYPGYMYTDLASLYERTGRIIGNEGSVTQIPILTMPDDDISHPIADLTGYITEGQIVLDRNLYKKGISPPVNPLPSLSRLMDKVAGKTTNQIHKELSDQLYSLYAASIEVRRMSELVGKDNLTALEVSLLDFSENFEKSFLNQGESARSLDESITKALQLLSKLDESLIDRMDPRHLKTYKERGAF